MQPIIGIIGKTDEKKKSEINRDYVYVIEQSGGVPILLPYSENADVIRSYVEACNGFLFVGGVDIDPCFYGESVKNGSVNICSERDGFDVAMISEVLKTSKPILAICRGIQLVNVALGGSLIQDIPTQINSQILHKQSEGRYEFSHSVNVEKCSPLYAITKEERIRVNSFHHQAINRLADGLKESARSEDGIVEAVYGEERFIRGYQWHPELLFAKDSVSQKLFEEFVLACVKE